MRPFHITVTTQDITFGRGALDQAPAVVERFGWRRLMLCASARARASDHAARLEAALGSRLVATFTRVEAHVPEAAVAEGVALALRHEVDALIALGGGSAIGVAKAISIALDERPAGAPTEQPRVPVLAIPTTYAGSEMTAVSGVTRRGDGVSQKVTTADPRIAPRAVIYDPLLTLDLPPRETAGTGFNAIAHCVEALYSITRNPLATAAALAALPMLARPLPRLLADGADIAEREGMLRGAYLAGVALAHVTMGLSHGICHVLGGATGAAHGDLNAIMLPHAMRFNLETTAPELAPAAQALDIAMGGSATADAVALIAYLTELAERAPLPRRLRELGVEEERLPALARLGFASRTVQNNPRPVTDVAQIEALLRVAW